MKQTSSCRRSDPARQHSAGVVTVPGRRGFTLVEILVVLTIIGVMVGMFTMGFPDSRRQEMETEALRLAALLRLAVDEAMLEGVEIGLQAEDDSSYQFMRFDEVAGRFAPLETTPFRSRRLPQGITLQIAVEGEEPPRLLAAEPLDGDDPGLSDDDDEAPVPPILLLSSGETTPFTLTLHGGAGIAPYRLHSDGFSGIQVDSRHDP